MAPIRFIILAIVGTMMLVSCGVAIVLASQPSQPEFVPMPTAPAVGGAPALERGSGAAPDQPLPPASERLVIKNALVMLEVVSVIEAEAVIR